MTPEEYSRQPQSPVLDEMQVHHSLHSLERFYSREKSLELLDRFEAKYAPRRISRTMRKPVRKACGQISGRKRIPAGAFASGGFCCFE